MEYVRLGRSSLKVSKLCLGTMTFGKMNEVEDAFAIMDRARELGINYFDTANTYGGGIEVHGRVEQILGKWFGQGGGRRESTILSTKFCLPMYDDTNGVNDEMHLSAWKLKRELERSLKRLETDYVDIYYMHHIDRGACWEEMWGAYENVIAQGKVIYAGTSNFAAWDLVRAQYEAKMRGFMGTMIEQHKYNLFCRLPELEVMPACEAMGINFSVYNPLSGGYLAENGLNPRPGSRAAGNNIYTQVMGEYNTGIYREQLVAFDKLCKEVSIRQSDMALAWVCMNPMVGTVVIGPRTMEHLENSVKAAELKLDDSIMKRLDEIFPGPGGDAPRAYMRF